MKATPAPSPTWTGDRGRFVRVSDEDPEMLRYLDGRGISLGDALSVVERQPFDGPLTIRVGAREHVLGGGLARAMRIEATAGEAATQAQH